MPTAVSVCGTSPTAPAQIGQALVGHTGAALDVAFTPDGRALATSSLDQTAIVWDLTDHSVAGQVGRPLAAGSGAVWSSAVVPGRDVLVAAGEDRMLRLWDVTDRAKPLPLDQPIDTGQIDGVVDTSLSADGRLLAAAGADRSVTLWDLSDPHAAVSYTHLTLPTNREV